MASPKYRVVRGFKFPVGFEVVEEGLDYVAHQDDIFIVTYPKCGTTWLQQIVVLILNGGNLPEKFERDGLYSVSPFLELNGRKSLVERDRQVGGIKTHLTYELIPKNDKTKYILVTRNPKDTAVSFYHHHRMLDYFDGDFSNFLDYFMKGDLQYGSYFDWMESWLTRKSDPNILWISYEDMKSDLKSVVRSIGHFLGVSITEDMISLVMEKSTLTYMRQINSKNFRYPSNSFFRKGVIGDWRSHFTSTESDLMDDVTYSRLSGKADNLLKKWRDLGILKSPKPQFKVIRGLNFPTKFSDVPDDALNYVAKPNDLFIVTYPKCGTTWVQHMVVLILNQGRLPEKFFKAGIFGVSPFLEFNGRESAEGVVHGRAAIKTHLPYNMQPKHEEAKYILVIRNPKDVAVSFFYHHVHRAYYTGTFSDYLAYFMEGQVSYGDYFDWITSWWHKRNDPKCLWLFYEDMKADHRGTIEQIMNFLEVRNDPELVDKVAAESTIENLRRINAEEIIGTGALFEGFFRKGIVGDWRNHLTKEESDLMDKLILKRLTGVADELIEKWRNFEILGED